MHRADRTNPSTFGGSVAVVKMAKEKRDAPTLLELTPKGDSQAGGLHERGILNSEGLARTVIDYVEKKLGVRLPITDQ